MPTAERKCNPAAAKPQSGNGLARASPLERSDPEVQPVRCLRAAAL